MGSDKFKNTIPKKGHSQKMKEKETKRSQTKRQFQAIQIKQDIRFPF
jgi:hypothetical protein